MKAPKLLNLRLVLSIDSINPPVPALKDELGDGGNLWQILIDSLPDYLYVKDTGSRFLVVNAACARQLGVNDPQEIIGKTDADFVSPDLAARYLADEQQVMSSGDPMTKEEPTQHKESGEMRWSLTTKMPLKDKAGNVIALVGIGRDITPIKKAKESLRQQHDDLERRVAERTAELSARNIELAQVNDNLATTHQLVEAMLNNIPDRVYFKDANSRFIKLSKALAKRFGLEDPDLAVGKSDFDFMSPEKAQEFYHDEQQIIQTGAPLINKIEKQILPNGETAWTSTTKVPLRHGDRTIGIVGINRDITSLKVAEQKLAALHKELLEASRQAGMAEVAIGVLHNVGNVLNSVNVAVSVIADRLQNSKASGVTRLANLLAEQNGNLADFMVHDPRGQQVPSYLKQLADHLEEERVEIRKELGGLVRNVEHIKEIVSTQQNYARVLGVSEVVSLSELLEDALKIHCGAFDRHGVNVTRDYDPMPDISVDKHKLLQILVNFLSNAKYACEAGNAGDKKVVVRLKSAGEGRVRIEVTDNGIGIPPENLTRVFSQGFTTRKGGHGFGLHSAALAVREMGGSIHVVSNGAGEGATFSVELPLVPPKNDTVPPA